MRSDREGKNRRKGICKGRREESDGERNDGDKFEASKRQRV